MSDVDPSHTVAEAAVVARALVFGVRSDWCLVVCPACDAEGYVQEDVHPVPLPTGACCVFKHVYDVVEFDRVQEGVD